jgi:hypothetical protein
MNIYTTAHELGHLLNNQGHIVPSADPNYSERNLMHGYGLTGAGTVQDNDVTDTKRIWNFQLQEI